VNSFRRLLTAPKPLTDAEFVEQARRNVERSQRYGFLFLPLLIGFTAVLGWVVENLFRFLFDLVFVQPGVQNIEVVLGAMTGFMSGMLLIKHGHNLAFNHSVYSKIHRLVKLLTKYYDVLHAKDCLVETSEVPQNRLFSLIDRLSQQKFFGLPIISRRKTDAEFVERMRKNEASARRFVGCFFVPLNIMLFVACLCMTFYFAWKCVAQGGIQFLLPMAGGILAGIVIGFSLLVTAHYYMNMIHSLRKDRAEELLVRYHDMLLELAHSEINPTSMGTTE
jgi:hypothetical protein